MKRFFRQYGRLTLALAAVLAFCAVLPLLFQQSRSIETGSWGLSFRTEGQPPVGNASKETLRRYDAVYLGDETQKKIYLTFDAGYENGCTEPILEALAKHNVKAAFFVVGNYIEQNPDLVRRMLREGHIVGNHTYHHYDMSKLSDEAAFNQELTSLETLYRETTRRGYAALLPPAAGHLQRVQSRNGAEAWLPNGILVAGLRRLVPGQSADRRAGVFQASAAHSPGRDRAAALDIADECANFGHAAEQMGGDGLFLRNA